jgi:hypothetical protein
MYIRNTPTVLVYQALLEGMRPFLEMGVWLGGQIVYTVGDTFKLNMLKHIQCTSSLKL